MTKEYIPVRNRLSLNFFKAAYKYFFIHLSRMWFIPPQLRPKLLGFAGHYFSDPKSVFIGVDVLFDRAPNARTHVGAHVTITSGVKIMNHFITPGQLNQSYTAGDVHIEDGVFIGMNALIVKPVRIGKGAVVAAGSVVTQDVPGHVVVGGMPAAILKEINDK